jgi:hypothetical protein
LGVEKKIFQSCDWGFEEEGGWQMERGCGLPEAWRGISALVMRKIMSSVPVRTRLEPHENIPEIAGATLRPAFAARLARLSGNNARVAVSYLRPVFRLLAEKFSEAAALEPHAVTVVNADGAKSEDQIRTAEGEESFHRAVVRATGGQDLTEKDSAVFLRINAAVYQASQLLRNLRPHLTTEAEVADELAAMIRNGEWAKIGLTDSEAAEAWYQFAKWLSVRYGQSGKVILDYGHSAHAGTRDRIQQEEVGSSRRGDDADREADSGGTKPRFRPDVPRSGQGRPGRVQSSLESAHASKETSRERSLFDAPENDDVAESAARDRDQLEGERLTAQMNAPLTREEQLKKLKRSKDKPQTSLFGDDEEPPAQGSFVLGSGLGAMQPYVEKFISDKVVPSAKQAGELIAVAKNDILKLLAPGAVPGAQAAHLIVRRNAAELARSTDRAQAALAVAGKYFAKQKPEANYDFMDRMERGVAQADPALNGFAKIIKTMLDQRRTAVQDLGTGKLRNFIENYFPHIWENTKEARTIFANFAKRPLEGSKNFLEERTIDSIAQGLELGLKPISDNPVDLVLLKLREMDKYLMAHHLLADLKAAGQLTFHRADAETPKDHEKIKDKVATMYVAPSRGRSPAHGRAHQHRGRAGHRYRRGQGVSRIEPDAGRIRTAARHLAARRGGARRPGAGQSRAFDLRPRGAGRSAGTARRDDWRNAARSRRAARRARPSR